MRAFCDDCSDTFTFQMRSCFVSFFTDQNVLPVLKGCVPELVLPMTYVLSNNFVKKLDREKVGDDLILTSVH